MSGFDQSGTLIEAEDVPNTAALPSLCGDCLRVRTFASWNSQEAARCDCGAEPGTFCMCDFCQPTIEALRLGVRGTDVPGLQGHVNVVEWTEEGGANG